MYVSAWIYSKAREIKRTGTMANKPTSTGRSVECIDRKEESYSLEKFAGQRALISPLNVAEAI